MSPSFHARHLDVAAFAAAGGRLEGTDSLQKYERLTNEIRAPETDLTIHWQAQGEERRAADGSLRPALHLRAQSELPMTCQRCLGEVVTPVAIDRHFVFVPDEAQAAALDDASEDDVLALSAGFNLYALIEDELLMALPLVPRHEVCPEPVRLSAKDAGFDAADSQAPAHPFAALAALKRERPH